MPPEPFIGQGVMIPSGGMDGGGGGAGFAGPYGGMGGGDGGGGGPLNGSPHGGGNGGDEDMPNNHHNNNIEPGNGDEHNVEETESLMSEQAVKVRPPAKFFVGKPQKFQANNNKSK